MSEITVTNLLPHFGGKKKNIADCLGVTKQLVSQWPLNDPIPNVHQLRLKYELKPELFNDAGELVGPKEDTAA